MENKTTNFKKGDTSKNSILGKAEALTENLADTVGDMLESVGDKISQAGAPKIGKAVHDLGDKIEHTHDEKKNSNTPRQ